MGCCYSKKGNFDTNGFLILTVEQSLDLGKIPFDNLAEAIDKFSCKFQMTQGQFVKFCEFFQIKKNSKESLLITQYRDEEGLISTLKIKATNILLSPDARENKIRNFFRTYNTVKTGALSHNDINLMITDIFEISVQYLVKFASTFIEKTTSESLSEYYIKLSKVKNVIIFYLFQRITTGCKKMKISVFEKCFESEEMDVLLIPKLMRNFSFLMQLSNRLNNINSDEQTGDVTELTEDSKQKINRKLSKIYITYN